MSLREFADHVAAVLAETAHGVRVAGDPEQLVQTSACAAEPVTSCSTGPARRGSTST